MSIILGNRNRFEEISKSIKLGVGSLFKKINRYTCPCCGYPTLEERNSYEICELCNWEDDGQDDEDSSEVFGGPNADYSLDHARENFSKYSIMYSPDNNSTITGGDSVERNQAKEELISVFNEMLEFSGSKTSKLWARAVKVEKKLDEELERSIREHERKHQP